MPNRDRLLLLLQMLQNYSDEEIWLTTAQVRELMAMEGYKLDVRSLRRDVQSLRDNGYKIGIRESEGLPTQYAWLNREWTSAELQVLIDAVSAAQFITKSKSRKYISRLAAMAGPSQTEELKPQILISERVKAKNRFMAQTVLAIRKAISRNRKISFRYLQYTPKKEQVPKHAGTEEEWYTVSPYATVWNSDRYYLVGWSDKRNKVTVFRIDRMEIPKQLTQKRIPAPKDFDVRDYTDKVFRMYGGPEEQVTLRCSRKILDQVIDRFGEGPEIRNLTEESFEIMVPVSVSGTFYAWVFQYTGEMQIVGPESVREGYAEMLRDAVKIARTEGDIQCQD